MKQKMNLFYKRDHKNKINFSLVILNYNFNLELKKTATFPVTVTFYVTVTFHLTVTIFVTVTFYVTVTIYVTVTFQVNCYASCNCYDFCNFYVSIELFCCFRSVTKNVRFAT